MSGSDEKALEEKFLTFCPRGKDNMTTQGFTKILTDAKIYNKHFKKTDAGLVFAKAKTKGKNVITFKEFQAALGDVASRRAPSKDADTAEAKVISKIVGSEKALTGVTQTEKLTDGLTEQTGVYKRGGGTNKDADKDLSALANRSVKVDARGVPIKD